MSSLVKPHNRSFPDLIGESRKNKGKTGFPLNDCGNDRNRSQVFLFVVALATLFSVVLFSTSAFADYKIILKNGREFVVDDYKDMDGKIKFYREGGEIELDKDIIKDIKKTKALKRTEESSAPETTKDAAEKPSAEKSAQPQKQEIDSKLKEIAGKKAQLRAEGEKLIAERKKLEEDIKKKGRVLAIREKREIEKQISELETKIKKFNEEISSLDQEQEGLLKGR
ncbi:MAG: hypothetical protein Q8K51_10710 [Nitrospirota bacterium]|nr:hypothetical protein [Nitrospirota bacterium]